MKTFTLPQLFLRIGELIEDRNCSNFEIIGWKHLDIKVKLIYDDCDEYSMAEYTNGDFSFERLGFTPDKGRVEYAKEFKIKDDSFFGEIETPVKK